MPLIHYICECKYAVSKFHRQVKSAPPTVECKKCGKDAKKAMKAPASTSTVIVDNGFMARSVEVNPEIVAINEERANKDYKND